MKRTLALLLACSLSLPVLYGCANGAPADESVPMCDGSTSLPPSQPWLHADKLSINPASSETVNEVLSSFGLELLQKTREEDKKSTLISPLSVALALSMTANGADGNTLAQFQEVLGGGVDLEELNAACAQYLSDYQGLLGSSQCRIANSLWKDHSGGIYEDFVSKCRGYYSAQVYEAELSEPRIVDDLNSWVSDKTNKMIPQIIDQPFPEETACLLVNALYLKNKWLNEFDPLSTHERDFRHEDGTSQQVEFLSKHNANLSYLQGKGAQGVVLPYDDGRLAFFALIPDEPSGLGDGTPFTMNCTPTELLGYWLNTLEGGDLSQLINNREDALFLSFAMPKFTAEWSGSLEKILPELGLEDAFIPGTANFSSLGDCEEGYYISQVVHAAKIEVNEKGTEAAAATVVAPAAGSPMQPPEGVTLILDRPFLYGIVDLQNGVPLFLGTYE